MSVDVSGAAELGGKLDRLADALGGAGLDEQLERATQQLALDISARAPRGITGTLADSVEVRLDGHVAKATVTAPYAPPVVSGVPARGIAGRPFVDDAVASADEALSRALETALDALVRSAGLT